MFKQRVITALLLLPVVGIILFMLNLSAFALVMLLVNSLLAWEWSRLSGIESSIPRMMYAGVVILLCSIIWFYAPGLVYWPSPNGPIEWHLDSTLVVYWLGVIAWLIAFICILLAPKANQLWNGSPWPRLILGLIILAGFWVSVVSIRSTGTFASDHLRGGFMLLFMLTIIWAADVGGYIFGKSFGKHKLAPSISPGKTWEGFMGGMAMALLIAFIGVYFLELPVGNWPQLVAFIMVLGVISVFGDLFESLMKRQENLKDSSQLLPGHGGLMDRLDSTLAVAPFFLLVASWLGWI